MKSKEKLLGSLNNLLVEKSRTSIMDLTKIASPLDHSLHCEKSLLTLNRDDSFDIAFVSIDLLIEESKLLLDVCFERLKQIQSKCIIGLVGLKKFEGLDPVFHGFFYHCLRKPMSHTKYLAVAKLLENAEEANDIG